MWKYLARAAAIPAVALTVGCADHAADLHPTDITPIQHDAAVVQTRATGPSQPALPGNAEAAQHVASRAATGVIFPGTGRLIGASRASQGDPPAKDGDITLNFANADVRDVSRTVLGELLNLSYAIEASVQGTITLQTSRPVSRDSVLPAFEQALRLSGFALVQADGIYKVVPAAQAPRLAGMAGVKSGPRSAYGVEIVPLKYVAAQEMQRLLEPIAPGGGIVQTDRGRNLLIISGTEQERSALLDDIALFDVDWLAGMSFALFTPKFVEAKTLAGELGQVIGGRDGPLSGVIRLVAIERLNAVLAISPQAKYLSELQTWVDRLDRGGQTTDQRIYVYYVQNGRATDLASVLTKVVNSQSGQVGAAPRSAVPTEDLDAPAEPPAGQGFQPLPPPPLPRDPSPPTLRPSPSRPQASLVASVEDPGRGISAHAITNVRITADETNNALLVLASPREYAVVESALEKLDIPPLQVMLEAAVAEVTLTNDLRYGIQYFFQSGSGHQIVRSDSNSTAIVPTLPGFAYVLSSGQDIRVVLSALETITSVKVISAPKLLVLNNQTASLQVGDQVPIATQSAVSVLAAGAPVVNTIQFRDTGVILKVVPRVNEGGLVLMDVSQEVSDVTPTTSSNLNSPTIQQRKISSTVVVEDGETVALGGLITDNQQKGKDGLPLLQDIPVVGSLFRNNTEHVARTELLVLITPHVVQGVQRARSITEELRRKMPATRPLFDIAP